MVHNQYVCEHDRDGVEMLTGDDPALPPHVEWRECPECGAASEWDTELDESAHC